MSSSAAAGPPGTQEERRSGLGKYVKRMSSVFKREKPSKKSSVASSTPATPSTPTFATAKEEPTKEETTAAPAVPAPSTATPASPAAPAAPAAPAVPTTAPAAETEAVPAQPVTRQVNRAALQHERAKALCAKYGLTLELTNWIAPPAAPVNVQRVEKPIRMRVHRSCHHCGTTYGSDKVCAKCDHKRCKKCPRYPKKPSAGDEAREVQPTDRPRKKKALTVTSKAGGELVYQPVKQRVRRTCHKCQTLFIPPTSTVCESCRHVRCTKCPREPAKLSKWPNGYPGDAEPDSETEVEREPDMSKRVWRKPRTRVRWECEECHRMFIDSSAQCQGCGHERCDKCVRKP
ncbi:hypothetical protein BCR34DRAFT_654416 [Clohesyomyces aquaticus]|uniref:Uncharacterized protein n=1 Tax=Clohesyomyces aquaticus TaxID=1231657 RepID=A0A1Y2A8M2_9PLEO|nr:hypothetical protein BCR34DRAFT_654416 [Clohesyomyces aquaticus]